LSFLFSSTFPVILVFMARCLQRHFILLSFSSTAPSGPGSSDFYFGSLPPQDFVRSLFPFSILYVLQISGFSMITSLCSLYFFFLATPTVLLRFCSGPPRGDHRLLFFCLLLRLAPPVQSFSLRLPSDACSGQLPPTSRCKKIWIFVVILPALQLVPLDFSLFSCCFLFLILSASQLFYVFLPRRSFLLDSVTLLSKQGIASLFPPTHLFRFFFLMVLLSSFSKDFLSPNSVVFCFLGARHAKFPVLLVLFRSLRLNRPLSRGTFGSFVSVPGFFLPRRDTLGARGLEEQPSFLFPFLPICLPLLRPPLGESGDFVSVPVFTPPPPPNLLADPRGFAFWFFPRTILAFR